MKALEGVRILDMTHVQSGPTCTQLLAWFGADVIKVERPGVGDATRGQLRDIPDVDSLYFTMLNHNKRSITINTKSPAGKEIFTKLIAACDVLAENFAPGALDRMGFSWERIQEINPRIVYASVKGFGPGPYQDCKVYENIAQCTGGGASTTGFDDGPPTVTGAQIGDSGTGLHLALGIVTALFQREKTGRGQRVECAMQDGVLNLCRVKLRDQQRLARGPLTEYPQYPNGTFGDATPRSGNASGGGQPGSVVKCRGWEHDPNSYIYVIAQAAAFDGLARVIGRADWLDDPEWNTPEARLPKLDQVFAEIEKWTQTKTKFEVMETLNPSQRAVWPGPVHEGAGGGAVPPNDRHGHRGRPSDSRGVFDGRQPDSSFRTRWSPSSVHLCSVSTQRRSCARSSVSTLPRSRLPAGTGWSEAVEVV